MLEDPGAAFLLPDELREKLCQKLAAIPEWPRETIWQTVQEQGDDRTALQERLATIWKALREKHQLAYANRDSSGQIHEGICSPLPPRVRRGGQSILPHHLAGR